MLQLLAALMYVEVMRFPSLGVCMWYRTDPGKWQGSVSLSVLEKSNNVLLANVAVEMTLILLVGHFVL